MKTYLDCIPCFVAQALSAARHVSDDGIMHEQVIRDVLRFAADIDLRQPPPSMGQRIHRRLRELADSDDPYRESKGRFTRLALDILPACEARLDGSDDPFELAVRYAIAGNVIDLGPNSDLTEDAARTFMLTAADVPLTGDIEELRSAVESASDILYIADNAGEIVFDRLLIERLPRGAVTVAVRGAPVINDATIEDADASGIHDIADVIDNGTDIPGTILEECSSEFRERFNRADLIIAKGQGNFETLNNTDGRPLFFLFKVKCPLVARRSGFDEGAHVIARNNGRNALP